MSSLMTYAQYAVYHGLREFSNNFRTKIDLPYVPKITSELICYISILIPFNNDLTHVNLYLLQKNTSLNLLKKAPYSVLDFYLTRMNIGMS